MRHCKLLFDDGEFGIVNGVGYPNPNRSHFESLDIWHRGLLQSRRPGNQGWLGHALDRSRDPDGIDMDGYFIGRQSVSAALVNRRAQVAALSRFGELRLADNIEPISFEADASIEEFVGRQFSSAYATSKQIESFARSEPMSGFPSNQLGQQMRLISQLIKSGSAARVYYTVQTGYDTHSTQSNTHSNLLFDLSSSIKSFVDDLKHNNLDDRVVVMAFSEFGRRVQENGSMGTDHGTAGPVFFAGTPIKGGITGDTTNLSELVDGDIETQFDFRQIYATVLDRWLEIPSAEILDRTFEPLDLV